MGYWHPNMVHALSRLRAEELIREAEKQRAALLASPSVPRHRCGLSLALVWWRALLPCRRVARVPPAKQEQA
jgi:hypothetical protein